MRSIEAKNLARGLALTGAVILTPSLLGCEGPKPQPTIPALGPAESAFRCANGEFTLDKTNLKGDRAVILDAIADSGINISQNEINLWKDCYNAGSEELPIFHEENPQEALDFGTGRIKDTIDRMRKSENALFSKYGNLLFDLQEKNKFEIGWDQQTLIWYDVTDQLLRLDFDPTLIDLDASQLSLATILVPFGVVLEDYNRRVESLPFGPTATEISRALVYTDDETIALQSRAFGLRSQAWIEEVARLGESYGEPDKGFIESTAQWERVGENWRDPSWKQFTFQNNPGLNVESSRINQPVS